MEHLASATVDGVAAALACYSESPGDERSLPLVGRLAEALQAAQADIQRLRESFKHELERGMDVSRFGYRLAVEDFERPAPTTTSSAARMEYVLRQAKRAPQGQQHQALGVQQSQTLRQGGGSSSGGGSGYWQARRAKLKAEKAKGGSGKAPFVGYSGAKNGKKKT